MILLINIGRPNEWSRHGPTIVSLTQQNWRAASILREPSGICFALDVTITSSPRLSTFLLTTYSGHDFFYMHRACKPFVELSVLPSVTVSEREASSACSSNRRPQTPQNAVDLHTGFMPTILNGELRMRIRYAKLAYKCIGESIPKV